MKSLIAFAGLLVVPLCLAASSGKPSSDATPKVTQHHDAPSQADPGERVFATNCARCHAAPMALSPRITGTVIMHMRTRARLSRQDEKLLLKFLAP